jgi:histidine triad (HIT) family protein
VEPVSPGKGIADLRGKPCIFCEILEGRAEAIMVYEDGEVAAIMDRYPLNPGHVLVMPREHFHHLLEMPRDRVARLFTVVQRVADAVHRATRSDGLGIGQNNGTAAAQVIPHVHVHVVPRYHGDTQEGRWLQRKQVSMEELRAMAEGIRRAMGALSA